MIRWLLPLQSIALAIGLTWPALATLTTRAVGSEQGDGAKHLWTLWWMRREAWDGAAGLRTDWVNYPTGMDLFPIEPLNGIFAALLPVPPIPLSNLLAIAHLALLGICAGWLGRVVSTREDGALAAGALAQGSAFAAFTLHVGVGELRQYWWIPLGLGCLVRARQTLDPRWFLALAGSLAGATISCFYHGFFLATAVSLYALATLRAWPRLLVGYALAAALSIAIVVPYVRTFSVSYGPRQAATEVPFTTWMRRPFTPETFQAATMDLDQMVRPRAAERATSDRQTLAYTGGRYLGIGTLILAFIGLLTVPRRAAPWLVVSLGGALLSLGTVLWYDGRIVTLASGARITLPLTYINHALSWAADPLNFPARFISVTMIALPVMAGLAMRRGWPRVLVPLALLDMVRHDLVPWPRETFALPEARGISAPPLGRGAVADLTALARGRGRSPDGGGQQGNSVLAWIDPESRTRGIAAQLELDRALQTVPLERADHWASEGVLWIAALPISAVIAGSDAESEDGVRASLWLLRDRGFAAVLLTHGCGAGPDAVPGALLDRWLGARASGSCATTWTIPVIGATDAEIAAWAAAQEARAGALVAPTMGPQFAPPPR